MRVDLRWASLMWAGRGKGSAIDLTCAIQKHSPRTFYKLNQMKFSKGHMIKYLLTELGRIRAGLKIFRSAFRTREPQCSRFICLDLEPSIFLSGPPTQSICSYYYQLQKLVGQICQLMLLWGSLLVALLLSLCWLSCSYGLSGDTLMVNSQVLWIISHYKSTTPW